MGTEIQTKTYFPGYHSTRNLKDNGASDFWALCHDEERSLKNSQNYDMLLTRPFVNGCLGDDKEQLRQTILKHETIFRHQLQELHRLYKRQRDLMNEIGRRELPKHSTPAETSQPTLFFSQISSEDAKKTCHVSNMPFGNSNSIYSPLGLMNQKSMPGPISVEDPVTFNNCESLESKRNMFQEKLFNPELNMSPYMYNKGKQLQERVVGLSGTESYPLNRNCEVTARRDGNLSVGSRLNSGCSGGALRCNPFPRRPHEMADLNEPIQVEGTSTSTSVDNLGNNITFLQELRRREVLDSLNSSFHLSSKRSSEHFLTERDGRINLNNLHPENGRDPKEQLAYTVEAGKKRCDANAFFGVVCPEESATPFKSLQVEPSKPLEFLPSGKSKIEPPRMRKIFGVEIPEGNHDQCAVAFNTNTQHPVISRSNVTNRSSTVSPCQKPPSSLSPNMISVQLNNCINTSNPFSKSFNTLMQIPEFVGGKMHVNGSSRSTSSLRIEESYRNGLHQSDAKQLPCSSSTGFCFPISISRQEPPVPHGPMKYSEGLESIHYMFQDRTIPQLSPGSVDVQRKHENPKGGLPWLKPEAFSSGEPTKISHQINFESLQNNYLQFACKNEIGKGPSQSSVLDPEVKKIGVSESPSNRKIFGFSIVDMPHTSKVLTSLSCASKSDHPTSEVDGDNVTKDLAHDPKSANPLQMNDLVTEKGLGEYIPGLKHHIDLNLCLDEEEDSSAPSLPRSIVKIATREIDLEAPAVLESETDLSSEAVSPDDQLEKPSELPIDKSKEPHEELVRTAAEAIIVISSSGNRVDVACPHPSEASRCESLDWFAELICSFKGDNEGEANSVSMDTSGSCHEESIPDGMDYFEFMTLQLTETKVEEFCYKLPVLENQNNEETTLSAPKRPRKGQAKRGRHQKDFQRDILPGLVSLSRPEVTEDLQTFEELFRVSGFTWHSSLSRRNISKKRRRRRNLEAPDPALAPSEVSPPPLAQEPDSTGLGLEGRNLSGWGKRTRRLPRQRCPADNPSLAIKC